MMIVSDASICGLHYKHHVKDTYKNKNDALWSIIDDSRVMLKIEVSLTIVIYDHNMFIVQATV